MENLTINQRIIEVIRFLELTPTAFADEIGIQRSGLSHIIKGRNKPSLDVVQKIVSRYPDINLGWLVNGTGNMSSTTPSVINLRPKASGEPPARQEEEPSSLKNTLFDVPAQEEEAESLPQPTQTPPRQPFTHQDFQVRESPADVPDTTYREEAPVAPLPADTGKGKKISKILVFYNDNTFEEFGK